MARKDNQNELGAFMAAQNEISGITSSRLQNSQAEQAFLQQQQAANSIMMQAAQIGTTDVGQQVGGMNPQTQALLAQYGINSNPTPGKSTSTQRTTQSGGNIRIENNTTNNHEVKVINTGGNNSNGGSANQAKFQTWLSNSFAKQQNEYETQRRIFARRDRDLEKQSNKLMRQLESSAKGLTEKLNPENFTKPLGSQFKTMMILLMTTIAPKLIEPIGKGINTIETTIRNIFVGKNNSTDKGFFDRIEESTGKLLTGIKEYFDLFFEEREKAIKAVKIPGDGGGKSANPANWFKYLGNIISAAFGGLDSVVRQTANQERTKSKEKFINRENDDDFSVYGDLTSNANEFLFGSGEWGKEIFKEDRELLSTNLNVLGNLKGGVSGGSIQLTQMINQHLTEKHKGPLDTGMIAESMSLLKGLVMKDGSYKLGKRSDAEKFLISWGVGEYFNEFIEKGYIYSKPYRFIYYGDGNPEFGITMRSGIWEKGKVLPIDEKTIINQHEIDIYFITKEGFLELERLIGGEDFDISDSSNDASLSNIIQNNYKKNTGTTAKIKNSEIYQEVRDYTEVSNSYDHLKDQTYLGQKINAAEEKTKSAWNWGKEKIGGGLRYIGSSLGLTTMRGEYPETDEGKKNFIEDMYSVFSKELKDFYVNEKNLTEEEANSQAANMASILTAQAALESGYGTNENSKNFNYGNLTAIKNQASVSGGDKDANGNSITQRFRIFRSAEDFARALITLLDKGKQYNGSLMASSAEEYFDIIQRGYLDGSGKGKYAEDPEYKQKGLNSVREILPKIGEFTEKIKEEEEKAVPITFDNIGTPFYTTPDGNIKVYFDRFQIGNLKEGQTPWDIRTSTVWVDKETGKETPFDSNLPQYSDGKNSLSSLVNRAVSSHRYPELDNPYFEFNTLKSFLIGYQKLNSFSKRAKSMIKLTYTEYGREIPSEIPFYATPSKDGKIYLIETISILTNTEGPEGTRRFTGPTYEGLQFAPEYRLELSEETLKDCPAMRNPRFWSIKFEMNKSLRRKFDSMTLALSSSSLRTLEDGSVQRALKNGNGWETLSEEELRVLKETGILNKDGSLTQLGKDFYSSKPTGKMHINSEGWESMSKSEKEGYVEQLMALTKDPEKKAAIRMLASSAESSLQAIHDVLGISTPKSLLWQGKSPSLIQKETNPDKTNNSEIGFNNFRGGDDNRTYSSITNIYQSPWNSSNDSTGQF